MATRRELMDRLIGKLKEVAPSPSRCALCGNNVWRPNLEYAAIPLHGSPKGGKPTSHTLPLLPVSCTKCGNTHFVNLLILGFTEQELDSLETPSDDGKQ